MSITPETKSNSYRPPASAVWSVCAELMIYSDHAVECDNYFIKLLIKARVDPCIAERNMKNEDEGFSIWLCYVW